jgi:hypothetical protein
MVAMIELINYGNEGGGCRLKAGTLDQKNVKQMSGGAFI